MRSEHKRGARSLRKRVHRNAHTVAAVQRGAAVARDAARESAGGAIGLRVACGQGVAAVAAEALSGVVARRDGGRVVASARVVGGVGWRRAGDIDIGVAFAGRRAFVVRRAAVARVLTR